VCEGSGGGESELERLFEEEATKDHEVMSIAVLRLHNRSSLEARGVHKDYIVWFAKVIVRVYTC
jgi:hypothetical protein